MKFDLLNGIKINRFKKANIKTQKVVVVGASVIDIIGTATILKNNDSSCGNINLKTGGMARNTAENLARLGVKITFISAVGDDDFARYILDGLSKVGIELNLIRRIANKKTSVFMSVASEDTSSRYSINDTDVFETVDVKWIEKCKTHLNNTKYLIMDCNIKHDVAEELISSYDGNIIILPASYTKAKLMLSFISSVYATFLNKDILSFLSGTTIRNEQDILESIIILNDKGVKNIFVPYDNETIYVLNDYIIKKIRHKKIKSINTFGSSEAFISGFVAGLQNGEPIEKAVEIGLTMYLINAGKISEMDKNIEYNKIKLIAENLVKNLDIKIITTLY